MEYWKLLMRSLLLSPAIFELGAARSTHFFHRISGAACYSLSNMKACGEFSPTGFTLQRRAVFFKIRNHIVFPSVMLALIAGTVVAWTAQPLLGLSAQFAIRFMVLFSIGAAGVAAQAARHLPPGSFGPANRVTLARGAITALLLALVSERPNSSVAWFAVLLALAALILDGIDGWLARRHGDTTPFGARFDMETDALLILCMALLAWHFEKAGAWVLASGLLRYLFVVATHFLPGLQQPLPASRRRRVICVVQIVSLMLSLLPFLPRVVTGPVALIGLAVLTGSFAIDLEWLVRVRRPVANSSQPHSV